MSIIILTIILMIVKIDNRKALVAKQKPIFKPFNPIVRFDRAIPPVRRIPIALARRFFQICMAQATESLAGEDLTPLEHAILVHLNNDSGEPGIDQNALAARLGVDRNNTSLLIERLVAKGLVERRVNGADRRARLLRLTTGGEKLHRRLRPGATSDQFRLLECLKPHERELLLDLLVRVIEANRVLARPGAGRRKRGSLQSSASEK